MNITAYINAISSKFDEVAEVGSPYVTSIADDKGTMFLLDNMIRTLHLQLDDHITSKRGNTINNTMDYYLMSESRLVSVSAPYAENPEAAMNDDAVCTALANFELNRAKVEGLRAMLDEMKELYFDTFGVEWEYVDFSVQPAAVSSEAQAERVASLWDTFTQARASA